MKTLPLWATNKNNQLFLKEEKVAVKILQVFSHNALVAKNDNNESMVLVGKGIGFNKGKGDRINESAASEIYVESKRQQLEETQ